MFRFVRILVILGMTLTGSVVCFAQTAADNRSMALPRRNEDRPLGIQESLEKMRIQREKKEHLEMVERGEEALKLSQQLENAYAANGKLTDREFAKIAAVEKIVKKIREDLGGGDDGDKEEKENTNKGPLSPGEAVKSLKATTVELFDQLKKTSRFTISAAAIQTSNAVIRIARFLRISN